MGQELRKLFVYQETLGGEILSPKVLALLAYLTAWPLEVRPGKEAFASGTVFARGSGPWSQSGP